MFWRSCVVLNDTEGVRYYLGRSALLSLVNKQEDSVTVGANCTVSSLTKLTPLQ